MTRVKHSRRVIARFRGSWNRRLFPFQVGMALNDSYSARCPDELASLATKSAYHVAYYSGFEEDATGDSYYNYNDYVTDLDALCGYRSQLNPPYMFIVAKVKWAVDIKTHKHVSIYKSHNVFDKYPTMLHIVTEMCTSVHISFTKWCILGYGTVHCRVCVQHIILVPCA